MKLWHVKKLANSWKQKLRVSSDCVEAKSKSTFGKRKIKSNIKQPTPYKLLWQRIKVTNSVDVCEFYRPPLFFWDKNTIIPVKFVHKLQLCDPLFRWPLFVDVIFTLSSRVSRYFYRWPTPLRSSNPPLRSLLPNANLSSFFEAAVSFTTKTQQFRKPKFLFENTRLPLGMTLCLSQHIRGLFF